MSNNDFLGSRKRFDANDLPGLTQQLNNAFQSLTQGSLSMNGVRLELRSVVPTAAPQSAGSPTLVAVLAGGVITPYWWNGAAWVDLAAVGGGGGEANTASNVNVGGVGVFKQKTAVNLEFKGINAATARVTVTNDAANNEIDIDVAEASLDRNAIGGGAPLGVAKGGTGLGSYSVGDMIWASATGTLASIAANATATRKFLRQVSSAIPAWDTLVAGDIPAIPESGVTNLTTDLAAKALGSRLINTTAPVTGGGDLTADRTIALTLGAGLAVVSSALASTDVVLSKNADQATFVNAQTNISGFVFTPGANEIWDVAIVLPVTMGTAATGVKFYFTGPAGFTGEITYEGNVATATTWQSLYQAVLTVPGTFFVTGIITGVVKLQCVVRTAGTSSAVQLVGITGGATTTCAVKKGARMLCKKSVGV